MLRITDLRLPLDHTAAQLDDAVRARLGVTPAQLLQFTVFKRSYDARKKSAITLIYTLDCALGAPGDAFVAAPELSALESQVLQAHAGDPHLRPSPDTRYRPVGTPPISGAGGGLGALGAAGEVGAAAAAKSAGTAAAGPDKGPRPVVVGFGPCGLFAALILAQMGLRPLVLERGKAVRERTRDTWGLWRQGVLDPESNVQFGEGGAGTFSDGKLWSQISDPRHLTRKVLTEFVKAGAPEEILFIAKPHIGTFRLVGVVEKMRAEIIALGGEIRFQARVVDLQIEGQGAARQVRGLTLASGEQIDTNAVVLALGHSARDTFEMLHLRGVAMVAKPFSVGFRIEHPQSLIDRARFGAQAGHPLLGAADYKLVHHAKNGRSVYSFCMCPGGTVVAATSEMGRVVTNGMSQYSRNERNANAGIVVGIDPKDYRQGPPGDGPVSPLDGMVFQRHWESRAFDLGGQDYQAPGQRVGDFLAARHGRAAAAAFDTVQPSYKPGVRATDLSEPGRESLPSFVLQAIREALPAFERQIAGFAMADAVLTGVETRTSSPLRVPRGPDLCSTNVAGLYPAGEGAGYAGGIMSAAVDGIEVAEAVARRLLPSTR